MELGRGGDGRNFIRTETSLGYGLCVHPWANYSFQKSNKYITFSGRAAKKCLLVKTGFLNLIEKEARLRGRERDKEQWEE